MINNLNVAKGKVFKSFDAYVHEIKIESKYL